MAAVRPGLSLLTPKPYCSPVGTSAMIVIPRDGSFARYAVTGRSFTTASTLPAASAENASVAVLNGTTEAPFKFSFAHDSPVVPDWTPIFFWTVGCVVVVGVVVVHPAVTTTPAISATATASTSHLPALRICPPQEVLR